MGVNVHMPTCFITVGHGSTRIQFSLIISYLVDFQCLIHCQIFYCIFTFTGMGKVKEIMKLNRHFPKGWGRGGEGRGWGSNKTKTNGEVWILSDLEQQ